ncbi:MAG: 2,3-diketo-5-methylthio-1-phosphopentane phosphatase [Acidobacteria bacterium RIFCSPLOWO2_12_FULL_65_11]|nr:MAG: 2,3-diketo-5-methylthio-1-phosphopentane phosphatase [Acidobacteria bacterium RIFCSPLOWO2_02_FULL_64_15]OFW29906.1 MAG: 2,3-diketo-5-methylthio-1-phosphopentane phosphatase [Acidobacteria bacterium RIFCSPLOWO2_12_FULL_65_11]
MTVSLSALHARAIVLDIEGTTTPVDFVYQVLFPFARAHVAKYLERREHSVACRDAVALLREEQAVDLSGGDAPPEPIVDFVHWLMDRDRKSRGLKALQGLIWQDGYRSGELRGQVYPDVPPALARWQARGLATYIYSSGSVLAQQLIFGSTAAGDLTQYLRGYFDTGVGPKTSTDSYCRIAESIGVPQPEILFVSDVFAELDAARAADLRTALCVRADGNVPASAHPVVRSFDDIID